MSIVVRELIIRARVEETNAAATTNGNSSGTGSASTLQARTEDIIAVCIERVMEAIEIKKER